MKNKDSVRLIPKNHFKEWHHVPKSPIFTTSKPDHMATRYRFGDNEKPHFITYPVINWIDVFSREAYSQILIDSLHYCILEKGLQLHAWMIMTNHVHLIASAKEGHELVAIIRDHKKFTSRMIIASIEENKQESCRDWLLWMFKRAGERNSNTKNTSFGSRTIILLN